MIDKLSYALDGLRKRFYQVRLCPSCNSSSGEVIAEKFPYQLYECENCALRYRWPTETANDMADFYQDEYGQAGLTTDLPSDAQLQDMKSNGFGKKDFTRFIELFKLLGGKPGDRILDFGANWGYGVYQFRQARFDATGYEISHPRARFAQKLGVEIHTDLAKVKTLPKFDFVFSSHVLEHTPNPAESIGEMLGLLKPGGSFVSVFPNGSEAFSKSDANRFNRLWGKVHPVMLNDKFLQQIFEDGALYLGSLEDNHFSEVAAWDQASFASGTVSTAELLAVWRDTRESV